ncbi:MAG: acetolactate decarboxylase [Actinobacteria bacterium]|nr:acetolactate decarboxylase [Actinomycetota bacterium]
MSLLDRRRGIFFPLCALLLVFLAAAFLAGCAQEGEAEETVPDRETLYQVSTLGALKAGFYDGDVTYAELGEHGDAGLGTFEGLDGEMIALDGAFYQIKTDGKAYEVSGTAVAPFAMVTFFDADLTAQPGQGLDYEGLQSYLDGVLPSRNLFYTIKIEGRFAHVKARSVPAQDKPYPPLSDAIANQTVFELEEVEGTMVGFWCPAWVGDINAPGYHMHFITADRSAGGHVLDLVLGEVDVYIDETPDFLMQLPEMEEFLDAGLD